MAKIDLYRKHPQSYNRLVSREDYQGNLIPALKRIVVLKEKKVIETGAGTGRLTRAVAPFAKAVYAFDLLPEMLSVAKKTCEDWKLTNCAFGVADNRCIPMEDNFADVSMEGWSLAQMAVWEKRQWKAALKKAVEEMIRVTNPSGKIVLIETLGTMEESPRPPSKLLPYYAFWESELGFQRKWVRTDYRFPSVSEAAELIGFFFGKDMARIVKDRDLTVIPECTGIWFRDSVQ